jgi:hypothetical protein
MQINFDTIHLNDDEIKIIKKLSLRTNYSLVNVKMDDISKLLLSNIDKKEYLENMKENNKKKYNINMLKLLFN